ncbi:hypothetical protein EGW08_009729, partial [Elysia chlorotica]
MRIFLQKRSSREQYPQYIEETSSVSNQSFTTLLKFWERAFKHSPKSQSSFSSTRLPFKTTKRASKPARSYQRRYDSPRQVCSPLKHVARHKMKQHAVEDLTSSNDSPDSDIRVRLNSGNKMKSYLKDKSAQNREHTPYSQVQVSFTRQMPAEDDNSGKCLPGGENFHRKDRKPTRKTSGNIRTGKRHRATPLSRTPKTDRMSIIYDLKKNQNNMSNHRSEKAKVPDWLSSTPSARTQFHSVASGRRQSPRKDVIKAHDLTCSGSVEAFRRQRLLDFIATCCRSQTKTGHSAGSRGFKDEPDTWGEEDARIHRKSAGKIFHHTTHDSCSEKVNPDNSSYGSKNKMKQPLKYDYYGCKSANKSLHNDKPMTEKQDDTMRYSTNRRAKVHSPRSLSKHFEPCLRVGNSPSFPCESPFTGGSRNTINVWANTLYSTPDMELHNTGVFPYQTGESLEDISSLEMWVHKPGRQDPVQARSSSTVSSEGTGYLISTGLDRSSDSSGADTPKNTSDLTTSTFHQTEPRAAWANTAIEHSPCKRNQRSNLTFITKPTKTQNAYHDSYFLGEGLCSPQTMDGIRTPENVRLGRRRRDVQDKVTSSASHLTFCVPCKREATPLCQKHANTSLSNTDSEDKFTPSLQSEVHANDDQTSMARNDTSTTQLVSSAEQNTTVFPDGSASFSYSKTATSQSVSDSHQNGGCIDIFLNKPNVVSSESTLVTEENKYQSNSDQGKLTTSNQTDSSQINPIEKKQTLPWYHQHKQHNKNSDTQTEDLDDCGNFASSLEKPQSPPFYQPVAAQSRIGTETIATQTIPWDSSQQEENARDDPASKDQLLEKALTQKDIIPTKAAPHGCYDLSLLGQNVNLWPLKSVAFDTDNFPGESDNCLIDRDNKSCLSEQPGGLNVAVDSISVGDNYSKDVRSQNRRHIEHEHSALNKVKNKKLQKSNSDTDLSYCQNGLAPIVYRYHQTSPNKCHRSFEMKKKLIEKKWRRSNEIGKLFRSFVSPTIREVKRPRAAGSPVQSVFKNEEERRSACDTHQQIPSPNSMKPEMNEVKRVGYSSPKQKALSKHASWQKYPQQLVDRVNVSRKRRDENEDTVATHRGNVGPKHARSDSDLLSKSSVTQSLAVSTRAGMMPRIQEARAPPHRPSASTPPSHAVTEEHSGDKSGGSTTVEIEQNPKQEGNTTREEAVVKKGSRKLATQDIEIVLGDDVTVREFMKCFIGGLDLELNGYGDSKLPTCFNLAGLNSQYNRNNSDQNVNGAAQKATFRSSPLNQSRNHSVGDGTIDTKPAHEIHPHAKKDNRKMHKNKSVKNSNQEPKHLKNDEPKHTDTKGEVIGGVETKISGVVTGLPKKKHPKAQGKACTHEKRVRNSPHQKYIGPRNLGATSPEKPTRSTQKARSPCTRAAKKQAIHESTPPQDSDAHLAWWERSALAKPLISKITTRPQNLHKLHGKHIISSSLDLSIEANTEMDVAAGKASSPKNIPDCKKENCTESVPTKSLTAESATVFWSSPNPKRRTLQSPQRINKNCGLAQGSNTKNWTVSACRPPHESKLLTKKLMKKDKACDVVTNVADGTEGLHLRRSKSTTDLESELSISSPCRTSDKVTTPDQGYRETCASGPSPRKSCSLMNLYRPTMIRYSTVTQKHSRRNAKKKQPKKKIKIHLNSSPESPVIFRKKKVRKIISTSNSPSHNEGLDVNQKRKTLSQKLMEKESCELGRLTVPGTMKVQKSNKIAGARLNDTKNRCGQPTDRDDRATHIPGAAQYRPDWQHRHKSHRKQPYAEAETESNEICQSRTACFKHYGFKESAVRVRNEKTCVLVENSRKTKHIHGICQNEPDLPYIMDQTDLKTKVELSKVFKNTLSSSRPAGVYSATRKKRRQYIRPTILKTAEIYHENPTAQNLCTYPEPVHRQQQVPMSLKHAKNSDYLHHRLDSLNKGSSESILPDTRFDSLESKGPCFKHPGRFAYLSQPFGHIVQDGPLMQSQAASLESINMKGNCVGKCVCNKGTDISVKSGHQVQFNAGKNHIAHSADVSNIPDEITVVPYSQQKNHHLAMTRTRQTRDSERQVTSRSDGVAAGTGKGSKEQDYSVESPKPHPRVKAEPKALTTETSSLDVSESDIFQDVREPGQTRTSVVSSCAYTDAYTEGDGSPSDAVLNQKLPRNRQPLKQQSPVIKKDPFALPPVRSKSPDLKRPVAPKRPYRRCDEARRGTTDSMPVPKPRILMDGNTSEKSLLLRKQQKSPNAKRTGKCTTDSSRTSTNDNDMQRVEKKSYEKVEAKALSSPNENMDIDDITMSLLLGKSTGENGKEESNILHKNARNTTKKETVRSKTDGDSFDTPLAASLGEDFSLFDLKNVIENTVKKSVELYMKNVKVEPQAAAVPGLKVNESGAQKANNADFNQILILGFSPPTSPSENCFSLNVKSQASKNGSTKRIQGSENVKDITKRLSVNLSPSVSCHLFSETQEICSVDSYHTEFAPQQLKMDFDQSELFMQMKENVKIDSPASNIAHQKDKDLSPIVFGRQVRQEHGEPEDTQDYLQNLNLSPEFSQHGPGLYDLKCLDYTTDGQSPDTTFRVVGPCSFYASEANAYLVPRQGSAGGHNVLLHLSQGDDWPHARVMVEPPDHTATCLPRVLSDNGYIHVVFGDQAQLEGKAASACTTRQVTPICENSAQTDARPLHHRQVQTETNRDCRHQRTKELDSPSKSDSQTESSLPTAAADPPVRQSHYRRPQSSKHGHRRDAVERAYTNNLLEMCTSLILGEMYSRHRPDVKTRHHKKKSSGVKNKQSPAHSEDESTKNAGSKSKRKKHTDLVKCPKESTSVDSVEKASSLVALNTNSTGCESSENSNADPKLGDSDTTVCSGEGQGEDSFDANTETVSPAESTRSDTPTTHKEPNSTLSLGQEEQSAVSEVDDSKNRLVKRQESGGDAFLTGHEYLRKSINFSDRPTRAAISRLPHSPRGSVLGMENKGRATAVIKNPPVSYSVRSSIDKQDSFPPTKHRIGPEDFRLFNERSSHRHQEQLQQKQQQYRHESKPYRGIGKDMESLYGIRDRGEKPKTETVLETSNSMNRRQLVGSLYPSPTNHASGGARRGSTDYHRPGSVLSPKIPYARSKPFYTQSTTEDDSSVSKTRFSPLSSDAVSKNRFSPLSSDGVSETRYSLPSSDRPAKPCGSKVVPLQEAQKGPREEKSAAPKYKFVVKSSDDEICVHKRKEYTEDGRKNKPLPSAERSRNNGERDRETSSRANELSGPPSGSKQNRQSSPRRKKYPFPNKKIYFTSSPSSSDNDRVRGESNYAHKPLNSPHVKESARNSVAATGHEIGPREPHKQECLPNSQRWIQKSSNIESFYLRRPSREMGNCFTENKILQPSAISYPAQKTFEQQRQPSAVTAQLRQRQTAMASDPSRSLQHRDLLRQGHVGKLNLQPSNPFIRPNIHQVAIQRHQQQVPSNARPQ